MTEQSEADAASTSTARPVVGVPACRRTLGDQAYHLVGEKYLSALRDVAGLTPVVLPAAGGSALRRVLPLLDGVFLTGSPSNVHPSRYGQSPHADGGEHDPRRDDTTFGLIAAARAAGLPLLAVCRGLQELNVALGGTLHQRLHVLEHLLDHREPDGDMAQRYAPAHRVSFTPDGRLAQLTGLPEAQVNSLHAQGIDRLAPGVRVEATSDDGLVEAFSLPDEWTLAVQWHPEWRAGENPVSRALFEDFGRACRTTGSRGASEESADERDRAVV